MSGGEDSGQAVTLNLYPAADFSGDSFFVTGDSGTNIALIDDQTDVTFQDTSLTLLTVGQGDYSGMIRNFQPGDTLDLAGVSRGAEIQPDGSGGTDVTLMLTPAPDPGAPDKPYKPSHGGAPPPSPRYEPLVLNLTGSATLTRALGAEAYFDVNSTGFAETTRWAAPGQGILVYDPSGGAVTNGSALFGTSVKMANRTSR